MDKRKQPPSEEVPPTKIAEYCIIHDDNAGNSKFTLLSNLKDPDARFKHIQNIRDCRLAETKCELRMEDACRLIPDTLQPTHGYHRYCYQRFTKNLDRLKAQESPSTSGASSSKQHARRSQTPEKIIFKPDCIFCNKDCRITVVEKGTRTSQGLSYFTFDGGETIKRLAKENNDLLHRRIENYDLFACEARYHPKCRKEYTRDPSAWRSKDLSNVAHQQNLEEAHQFAFDYVSKYLESTVIIGKKNCPTFITETHVYSNT